MICQRSLTMATKGIKITNTKHRENFCPHKKQKSRQECPPPASLPLPPVYFLSVGYLSQFLGTVPKLCPGTTSLGDSSGPRGCLATPGMDNAAWPRLPLLSKKEVAERNCSQYTSGYLQLPPPKKGGDFVSFKVLSRSNSLWKEKDLVIRDISLFRISC